MRSRVSCIVVIASVCAVASYHVADGLAPSSPIRLSSRYYAGRSICRCTSLRTSHTTPSACSLQNHLTTVKSNENDNKDMINSTTDNSKITSKRQMLKFAGPALGIFLCNPLLSNIDNALVGRTVGTQGLAALSLATVCTDQLLYLFGVFGRVTTGLVSRSYAATGDSDDGDTEAARKAASAPLTAALACGAICSVLYAVGTRQLISFMRIDPSLHTSAASYIQWRGAIAWAAVAQNVMLSIHLATRDAMTPLKIVVLAALVNVLGDAALCIWPCRWGCAGVAAATAGATLVSSGAMMWALHKKELLPKIRLPSKQDVWNLLDFTGPLLAITITRLLGTINMQCAAMRLSVQHVAAYQLSVNMMFFFHLFGEPLSQLSQTQLPGLVDGTAAGDQAKGPLIRATLKSILTMAAWASISVGVLAGAALGFGSGLFSSDAAVQKLARQTAPALFGVVATGIFTIAVDGSMLASRDFGFMLLSGFLTLIVQWKFLASPTLCTSLSAILGAFTIRLAMYALAALLRAAMGGGRLGRAMRENEPGGTETAATTA